MRRLSRFSTVLSTVVSAGERPMLFVMPLAALLVVWALTPDDLPGIGSVQHATGVLAIAALTWLAASIVQGVADGVIAAHPWDTEDNLEARRVQTQTRVLARIGHAGIIVAGFAFVLMTFPKARQLGASLLASAGVAGLILGIAARTGVRQPAGRPADRDGPADPDRRRADRRERMGPRRGDHLDLRGAADLGRAPPRSSRCSGSSSIRSRTGPGAAPSCSAPSSCGSTSRLPLEPIRREAQRLCEASKDWDRRVCLVQVTDANERGMQLRVLVSSASSGPNFDLRCRVREGLIDFIQREYPAALPRVRSDDDGDAKHTPIAAGHMA